MEHQKRDSSGIKTHEEIIAIFKELESMEEKVKNPELLAEELFEPEIILQEVERPPQIPTDEIKELQPVEPVSEIPPEKKEKKKRLPGFNHQQKEHPAEEKTKRLSFWRKQKIGEIEPDNPTEVSAQLEEVKPARSTFILQFDGNGSLTGLPVKKPKPEKEKKRFFLFRKKGGEKEAEQPEEEPVKGIKGKLKKVTSLFKRKKSSEGESSGGIGGKIKGILKRKSKE